MIIHYVATIFHHSITTRSVVDDLIKEVKSYMNPQRFIYLTSVFLLFLLCYRDRSLIIHSPRRRVLSYYNSWSQNRIFLRNTQSFPTECNGNERIVQELKYREYWLNTQTGSKKLIVAPYINLCPNRPRLIVIVLIRMFVFLLAILLQSSSSSY